MKNQILATRYITALHQSSPANEKINTLETLAIFLEGSQNTPELWKLLENPTIDLNSKQQLLDRILNPLKPSLILKHFLQLLLQKKRIPLLKHFSQPLKTLLGSLKNKEEVFIYTPVEFDKKLQYDLIKFIEKQEAIKADAQFIVDPQIIGGFKAKIGNKLYDATLNNALTQFKNKML